ncbi:MAG: hypothetical protein ACOC0M_00530 [Halomonas sp.]
MAILMVGLSLAAPAMAVNKCEIDGKTVYQQGPCPQGSAVAPVGGTFSQMGKAPDVGTSLMLQQRVEREKRAAARHRQAANQAYQERKEQERLERQARRTGIVAEGMSESDAIREYGSPDSTNVTQSGGRTCKHLRWRNPYRTVMVCDGEVRNSYAQDVD